MYSPLFVCLFGCLFVCLFCFILLQQTMLGSIATKRVGHFFHLTPTPQAALILEQTQRIATAVFSSSNNKDNPRTPRALSPAISARGRPGPADATGVARRRRWSARGLAAEGERRLALIQAAIRRGEAKARAASPSEARGGVGGVGGMGAGDGMRFGLKVGC